MPLRPEALLNVSLRDRQIVAPHTGKWRSGSNMPAQKLVFVPSHCYDCNVENCYCHQPRRVGDLKSEKLIGDEDREYQHRDGVVPKLFPKKSHNETSLDNTVAKQIERGE